MKRKLTQEGKKEGKKHEIESTEGGNSQPSKKGNSKKRKNKKK